MKYKKTSIFLFLTSSIILSQIVNASEYSEAQVNGYSATADSSRYTEESEVIANYGDLFFRQTEEEYERCWQKRISIFNACLVFDANGKENMSTAGVDIMCGMAADREFELCTTM